MEIKKQCFRRYEHCFHLLTLNLSVVFVIGLISRMQEDYRCVSNDLMGRFFLLLCLFV